MATLCRVRGGAPPRNSGRNTESHTLQRNIGLTEFGKQSEVCAVHDAVSAENEISFGKASVLIFWGGRSWH